MKRLILAIIATAIMAAVPMLFLSDNAHAQSNKGGTYCHNHWNPACDFSFCPAGTCGRRGGPRAMNLANCAASNCKH